MSTKADYFVVRRGATAVPNQLIFDKTLSYSALGVLVLLLSLPAGAKSGYRQLQGRGLGEEGTRKALKSLEEHNLRFRFRMRGKNGLLREVTVVSDTPLSIEEARAEIQYRLANHALPEAEIISCISHLSKQEEAPTPEPAPVAKAENEGNEGEMHRAGESGARSDEAVDKSSTVPRVAVARSAQAHISKDIYKSSLRSDLSNQPRQAEKQDRTWTQALPAGWLELLGGHAAARVAELITAGLAGGWTLGEIRSRLEANPLPPADQMRNPEGLVIFRVVDVVASDSPACLAVQGVADQPKRHTPEDRAGAAHDYFDAVLDGTCTDTRREQFAKVSGYMSSGIVQQNRDLADLGAAALRQLEASSHQAPEPASPRTENGARPHEMPARAQDSTEEAAGYSDRHFHRKEEQVKLKKLAAAGGIALASVAVSSPAFAANADTPPTPGVTSDATGEGVLTKPAADIPGALAGHDVTGGDAGEVPAPPAADKDGDDAPVPPAPVTEAPAPEDQVAPAPAPGGSDVAADDEVPTPTKAHSAPAPVKPGKAATTNAPKASAASERGAARAHRERVAPRAQGSRVAQRGEAQAQTKAAPRVRSTHHGVKGATSRVNAEQPQLAQSGANVPGGLVAGAGAAVVAGGALLGLRKKGESKC